MEAMLQAVVYKVEKTVLPEGNFTLTYTEVGRFNHGGSAERCQEAMKLRDELNEMYEIKHVQWYVAETED